MFLRKLFQKTLFTFVVFLAGVQSVFADGLPAENILTQRWRDMTANHSPITNPALLTEENYISLRGALAPILQGEFLHGEIGATVPVGLYQSLGFSIVGELDGSVTGSMNEGGQLVSDPKSTSSNANWFLVFSYAHHIWDRLSVGVNANFAVQTNFGDPIYGVGLDLGLTYRLLRHAVFGDHLVGLSTLNLIAPQMRKGFSLAMGTKGEYSRNLKITWLSTYLERRIESTLDFDIKDFMASAEEFDINKGTNIEWGMNYKIGLWMLRLFKVYLQLGFDEDAFDYWGLALGANLPSLNNGRDLEFLYQYNIMTKDENDATGHTIYLRADFGKHREEVYARKMARLASLSPNELYNKARKLYSEKKFWDAFFVFSRILVEFPDFFKNDWVQHFRAACQEEMDMRDVAIKNYEEMKKAYPLSSAVPHTDLGMMRIHYRNNDLAKVTIQYIELNHPNVPDSLRFHGAYLMGQSYLKNNDAYKAIEVLSIIPDGHPDYVFAQHALAVAHAVLDHDMSTIVANLENCIGTKTFTESQKEMVNRSYLFMGYIFYEENTLSKAVVALRMVPTTSYYSEDALLGQGWTALKARQWTDCIAIGQMLSKMTNKEALKCEGMLIESYGHLLQKNYAQALSLLNDASARIRTVKTPDPDSLNFARMQNESDRMAYNFLSEKVQDISNAGQTAVMVAQTDSLHTKQIDFVNKFKQYYRYADEFQRTTFFSRNTQQILDDIDYALATVQKIVGSQGIEKAQEKIDSKQQEIDSEIEKLKYEMEKLQEKNQ